MKIPISEIFESIQGEWRNTWKPSIFVRFWWCNLKCTWCDSKYSWDSKVETADMMSLQEVLDIIKSFKSNHIIFTWWEPTLFQEQMKIIQEELDCMWYTYELETNWSKELDDELIFNQVNISPKLKNSWNEDYNLEILKNLDKCNYVDLKFVAETITDLVEIDWYLKQIDTEEIDWIYIMPLWIDSKSQNNKYVLDYCIKKWYNYCTRQHLILFGNKKWA